MDLGLQAGKVVLVTGAPRAWAKRSRTVRVVKVSRYCGRHQRSRSRETAERHRGNGGGRASLDVTTRADLVEVVDDVAPVDVSLQYCWPRCDGRTTRHRRRGVAAADRRASDRSLPWMSDRPAVDDGATSRARSSICVRLLHMASSPTFRLLRGVRRHPGVHQEPRSFRGALQHQRQLRFAGQHRNADDTCGLAGPARRVGAPARSHADRPRRPARGRRVLVRVSRLRPRAACRRHRDQRLGRTTARLSRRAGEIGVQGPATHASACIEVRKSRFLVGVHNCSPPSPAASASSHTVRRGSCCARPTWPRRRSAECGRPTA